MLLSGGLLRLIEEYNVTLSGTVLAMEPQQVKRLKELERSRSVSRRMRILVYGCFRDRDAIAKLLSDHDLFLQNPIAQEYDNRVHYWNPQYLVKPGAGMPSLDDNGMASMSLSRSEYSSEPLAEDQVCEIMRILDSDSINSGMSKETKEVKQSARILTELKKYSHSLDCLYYMNLC